MPLWPDNTAWREFGLATAGLQGVAQGRAAQAQGQVGQNTN